MENWNEEQQKFIAKLEETKSIFDEILTKDPDGMVIEHGEQRAKLDSLKKSNDRVLTKLKTREFTVAIVGLEKAGKSTLGNALIKTMVLPEYSERCTYTTTEIRSGDTDVAEVYFYSREEFNQNFKRMLNDVKYPFDSDFFSMTLDNFNTYWHGVETDPERQNIFTVHNGTTAEDIKAILEGKQKLIPLLGQAKMSFGAEYWTGSDEFNEFKIYITGMSGKNPDGSVIRQPHPYAVKNIKIRSTQLAEMSHLVLYDVPGFDSPTELHKRQTEEMLKAADAIILVTNVGDRPNLTGTQLDMLRKGQDADGIKLSAKCFVFGNKIDRAVDSQTARNNFAALKNESVNKYQIALDNHVVCGSARAFLEKIGLIEGNVASSIIDEWGLSGGDGLSLLQEKMQQYYDNDRFEVLRRRAEKTIADAKNFLDEILATAKSQPRVTHSQYFMQAALEAKDNLKIFK
ncbi:MAG: dynamin family protein [Selenomonadaceae bacterium]|nr:dynamin family protein [Selenomonadaceae bacterium]